MLAAVGRALRPGGDASALWMEFPASTRRSQGALRVSREHVPSGWPAIFLGALIAIPVGRALQPWAHQMLARAVSAIHCVSTMKSVSFPVSSLMP